jgi:hypothetical protein
MTRLPPSYSIRAENAGPGADPDAALEAEWERADSAYDIWREDQVLNRALQQLSQDERNQHS